MIIRRPADIRSSEITEERFYLRRREFMTATLTKWYDEHGRHQIYAGGKNVELSSKDHNLVLDPEAVAAGKQTDLDELGVAKNAREEKLRARKQQQENERMRRTYVHRACR